MISRRNFLQLGAVIAGAIALSPAAVYFKPTGDTMLNQFVSQMWIGKRYIKALTRKGAVQLMLDLDRLCDQLEEIAPDPPDNLDSIYSLAIEIIPYYIYEGVRLNPFAPEVLPEIKLGYFGGEKVFHVAGRAACMNEATSKMWMSLRFYNRFSPWYGKTSQISTLVHELAHAQGICVGDIGDVETATQLATAEVLAAMTRHGNKYTLLPFMRTIERFADDFVMWDYLSQNDLAGYRKDVVSKRANHAFALANFDKSMEYWKYHWFELLSMLQKYGVRPHILLTDAMNEPGYWTCELPYPNLNKKLALDDTAYVLDHLDELVHDYPLLLES